LNYYPFHIGDYVSATRHLSWEEDAAFRRLLDTYYTTEKPIPADHRQACRLVMAQTESQREAVQTVLAEFFELTELGWVNKRAEAEIVAMKDKQQKQRDKANKRWGNAKQENAAMPRHEEGDAAASKTDADAMPPTPTPTPTPTPVLKASKDAPALVGFAEFWAAWPKHDRKAAKQQCQAKWKSKDCEPMAQQIVAAVNAAKQSPAWLKNDGEFIPAPLTWLSQDRWEASEGTAIAPIVNFMGAA
jgi:uncharacterized protein YdaU (DUF1376 family)